MRGQDDQRIESKKTRSSSTMGRWQEFSKDDRYSSVGLREWFGVDKQENRSCQSMNIVAETVAGYQSSYRRALREKRRWFAHTADLKRCRR
jgi:hypothetical protein